MRKAIVLALMMVLSAAAGARSAEKVLVCGTGDSQELLRALGAAFEKLEPGVSVVVPDSVGSDGAIKAALAGECDLGRVARPLKDAERELGLTFKVFAYSPVVFVVDPAAGVDNLTSRQILEIFSGKVTDWAGVGGKGGKISVVSREAKDSSRGELNKRIEGFKAIENPAGATATKTPEAVEMISKTPLSIGYLPLAMAKKTTLKIVKVDGQSPDPASVVQGTYRIATPFGLVWKGELKPVADRFVKFLKMPSAKDIIVRFGVVPAEMM